MFAESSHFSTVPFPDVLSLDRVSINVNVFWFVNFFKKGIPFGKNLNLSEVFIFIFKRLMKKKVIPSHLRSWIKNTNVPFCRCGHVDV